ncbi:MAG: hypothetical protein H6983_19190 [Ectothiorhodospiraceae bacterium]|nr:hypothetical protein [Chromatiales bacterium]MCP5156307.1 hypothetical protein [Ectothiorhodospiraceae bacterium]
MQQALHTVVVGDRRERGGDRRRRHPLLASWRYAFVGRRRRHRRAGDLGQAAAVLDAYDSRLLYVSMGIYVLCAMDAAFTLTLIEHGIGREANPVMDALLGHGVGAFLAGKMIVTGVGLVTLVTFSSLVVFGRLRLARLIEWMLGLYLVLIAYEAVLLTRFLPVGA